jgi:hypothetical protein
VSKDFSQKIFARMFIYYSWGMFDAMNAQLLSNGQDSYDGRIIKKGIPMASLQRASGRYGCLIFPKCSGGAGSTMPVFLCGFPQSFPTAKWSTCRFRS